MKAIVVDKPGDISVVDVPELGHPDSNEVKIKMKAAGVCGSDMHIFNGESAFAVYPNIMGHELAGEVVEVGENVSHVSPGDNVVINNVISCGKCYACKVGRPNVCNDVKVLGVHVEGGYKEYIKLDKSMVYKLPESVPFEYAALAEPYSIAAQVLDRGRLHEEDMVLICGAGPLGLITLQAIKRHNIKVAVLDIVDSRLDKAKELGADLTINSMNESVEEAVFDFTNQEGASLIVESTGNIGVLELCVEKLASQAGRIVVLGFPTEKAKISPYDIMRRELDIIGSRLNNNQFPTAIKWMENKEVDPSKIITHKFSYEEGNEAFKFIKENPNEVIKAVLQF